MGTNPAIRWAIGCVRLCGALRNGALALLTSTFLLLLLFWFSFVLWSSLGCGALLHQERLGQELQVITSNRCCNHGDGRKID